MEYKRIQKMNTFRSNRKLYLLAALLFVGGIASAQVTIKGTVYGGGEGIRTNEKTGSVTGNTSVTMNGGTVVQSLYGGGEFGSVGTFTDTRQVVYNAGEENELRVDVPTKCQDETGLAKVIINGGKIGFFKKAKMPEPGTDTWGDSYGYIFAGGRGDADSINYPKAIACAVVDSTYLEINDGVFITASIYGGCENGLLLGNSHVKVKGGQIGVGYYKTNGVEHLDSTSFYQSNYESLWTTAINAIRTGDSTAIANSTAPFHECHAWPFGNANNEYLVYDIFADSTGYNSQGGSLNASDGNTFFGKVYGGGSGYYPFWDSVNRTAVWRRSAGRVIGNTLVEIEGGHILTAVFGGNEMTDVVGTAIVKMSGGTVGVPQLVSEIEQRPLNSHIFGAGLGDQRTRFNQWTNVDSTYVYITGGAVFGSVFGGGQDGHVLRNACVIVKDSIPGNDGLNPLIGTWGYTTFDGNVFGAGRGYSGIALTAGSVGGNTEVNIKGGTMLGSIYGGGRLASVGSYFVDPENENYGKLKEDDEDGTYGYTIVNLTGGTIGNRFEIESDSIGNYVGGNVYGGSKGRLTLLDGTTNPRWEDMGKVKQTLVSVNDTTAIPLVIKGHVFGGGEIGRVEKNTLVDIDAGTIGYSYQVGTTRIRLGGDVYGGGMGMLTEEKAGLVKGNAYVDMSNGTVQRSLYGGGKYGSVGTFTEYYVEPNGVHIVGEPKVCDKGTGLAQVVISGGQVGLTEALMPVPGSSTYDDDFGYVFCGSRGEADSIHYPKANFLAVVDSTYLEIRNTINTNDTIRPLITASAYGGCENGMVLHNTRVKIAGGQIGVGYNSNGTFDAPYLERKWTEAINAIKGGTLTDALANQFNDCNAWPYGNGTFNSQGYPNGPFKVYDIFADPDEYPQYYAQVQEVASLNATDGNTFFGKVYGGGSGYYPIAPGVWRRSAGRVNGNTLVEIEGGHILTAVFGGNEITDVLGTATINMTDGTVGVPRTFQEIKNTPTTCHMFGSGMGDMRTQFNTWTNVNSTYLCITGGVVFGSVFGGGEDGHVIRNTCVTVRDSIAGDAIVSSPLIGTYGHTLFDGNVFGGGRGFSGDALTAGSVGGNTEVNIAGGDVLGSVYGGGRLASVGTYFVPPTSGNYGQLESGTDHGYTKVNVTGGTIGAKGDFEANVPIGDHRISGNVYGGSKGRVTQMDYVTLNPRWPSLAKVKQTEVTIDGADVVIKGDVFGGGEIGTVRDSTQVVVKNGTLMRDLFGGGYGSTSTATVQGCDSTDMTPVMIAGHVYGRTDATVSGGLVKHNVYGGGEYAKVGITADQGQSTVSLNGGVVGSHVPSVLDPTQDTLFGGMVYGGGMGILADTTVAMVLGSTYIYDTISNNSSPAHVLGHIHGGGEVALVQKNTDLAIGSAIVGTLANATSTVTKSIPGGGSPVTLYEVRALEGGRVFGGGQGVEDIAYRHAALVMGNTKTEITGTAQINGSVYGGGELASVGLGGTLPDNNKYTGSATVIISGGTIGPLNGSEHNGNVFGGGKGHEDLSATNDIYYATVDSTHVVIKTGANIAGSVFGGGANGRVLGNASTDIQGGFIGTTGLTTWDGNVFGGGRNYSAYNNTTGVVRGNTDIQMSGGTIKANMYGGGRFGSVGMDYTDDTHTSIDTLQGADHGYVTINITGGTIGGDYVQYLGTYNATNPDDDMPRTGFVFGGGRGIMEADKIDKLGNVKGTTVTVGGNALVKSSVYGGSERGIVYKNTLVKMKGNAEVGENSATMALHRGDVYGGGCGFDSIAQGSTYVFLPESGRVKGSTRVEMDGSNVYGNVFGGGEEGHVIHNTHVVVTDGTVGITGSTGNDGNVFGAGRGKRPIITGVASAAVSGNSQVDIQDGRIMGSVFGGGDKGSVGVYLTETTVNGVTYQPGDTIAGTDHGYTLVNVSGGWIGHEDTNGRTGGNVYGGCRGAVVDPDITTIYQNMAHVKQTEVNIFESDTTDTFIMGSVFGGGEDGHVFKDTYVNVSDGQIGGSAYSSTPSLCSDRHHGNVYGGGRGLDTYTNATGTYYSTTAGKVYGNTNVFIEGGYITRNVYGGGNLSTVGKADEVPVNDVYKTGLAKVTITGGTVGVLPDLTNVNGMVFGSARGMAGEAYKDLAMVKNTEVLITGDAQIKGSVFGSGEDGHTRMRTNVFIGDTILNGISYSANDLVIGTNGITGIDGNVYGGGRGLDTIADGSLSSTAGIVGISTTTLINNGTVKGSVFGGGNMASVGYEHVLDTLSDGTIILDHIPADFGKATVTVTGNAIVGTSDIAIENGNVFGSGKGRMGTDFASLSYVNETEVLVSGNAKVYGSVFGGGEDGHVRACLVSDYPEDTIKPGNTHVTIAENAVIGDESEQTSPMMGNVYGGGRGLDIDHQTGNTSPTAGVVEGNTKVDILNGTIWRSVFGGGNQSVVKGQRVTNVVNGLIHADVHGGSNAIPSNDAAWAHGGLKTVNIRGGHVMGDVYGCSHSSNDGEVAQSQANAEKWTSFVNISGGTIDEDVYGAGYSGMVNGSVCVNIGKEAILKAPNHEYNVNYNKPHNGNWDQTGTVEPTAATLVIGGSVYGGSDFYGSTTTNDFDDYDLTGYSLIFIDGTGYETTSTDATATNYMNIGGGLFGSGTHTESGQLGRHILLKDYGTRNETDGEMTSATRTLTTIQRSGNVVIDHANVNLIGIADISNAANENHYGVMRVSDTLAVINAGGIVLGDTTAELKYAHMDSIFSVQSLKLVGNNASIYDHNLYELKKNTWYWLGIQDEQNDANLYYISGKGANAQVMGSALDFEAENVVLYNDTSKLWVRYHEKKSTDTEYKQYYGELLGFFRMRGDEYHPINIDTVSFAYARPKITDDDVLDDENRPDGGWLSYNTDFNYFTDLGDAFTFTQQYPYINVLDYSKNDREDYRMWVDKSRRRCWYVDGTRGWGRDDKKKLGDDSGLYPDKPKYTLYGKNANGDGTGIVNEVYTANSRKYLNYSHKDDVIYVVGAISAEDEKEMLRDSTYTGDETHYRLKLYRYPGGHIMSNGKRDYGGAKTAIWGQPNGEEGDEFADYRGPGANYGAMLNVQGSENAADAASLEMRGVLMDGLYAYTEADSLFHEINDPSLPEASKFKPELDSLPLVLTHQNSTLTMHGGTILKRGYNNQNALDWYTDSDYKSYSSSGTPIYNGGAIFVDSLAIVNVSGLDSIVGNKQYLEFEGQTGADIECNAFLPTFATHLNITDTLDVNTKIGITSPIRNADPTYKSNTLSPVAVGVREGNVLIEGVNVSYASIDAHAAWLNNNFLDDLDWFFVNEYNTPDNERSTFYDNTLGWQELGVGNASKSLYFGWTWANVVRKAPEGFSYSNIDSPEDLAWLISKSAGLNRQTAIDFSNTGLIEQKKDIDLLQYVWVPVGDTVQGKAFKGSYDGRGHLITNLSIELLGKGDHRYERNNYGMFGYVDGGSIDRTFVVSGLIRPVGRAIERTDEAYNIGGLVGNLVGADALVTNSEAAVSIYCPDLTGYEYVAGGLVAKMDAGMVHSSMAMPIMTVGSNSGLAGGLVGSLLTGEVKNSFANSKFSFDDGTNQGFKAGGLLGHSGDNTVMQNCYSHWHDCVNLNQNNYSSIVVTTGHASIDSCYAMQNSTYDYTIDSVGTCGIYAPVINSDMLGYMYADNRVSIGDGNGKAYTADTTLFMVLNRWADYNKTSDIMYARWARPGIPEINGDLPVPMLYDDYDEDVNHQGDFRSVGTYAGGHVLQYGGPVRDGDDDEVDSALVRSKAGELDDYLFIYGDVNEIGTGLDITQGKVSIYEHAAILKAGSLANFDNTYVGVSFDNSKGSAMSTHGVNGMGIQELPRDWHMMSTPLRNAPLGFNYLLSDGTNTNNGGYIPGSIHGDYFNNPWAHHAEFSWLNGGDTGDNRYWMKGWTNSQITNGQSFNDAEWADGYFPSRLSSLHSFGEGCIEGADEYGRYPYGMDLYTWYEPEYHWINFKRNGPNHWHSDETATCQHEHISYYGNPNQYLNPNYLDKNEEFLISGKGYMASITVPTMLQSHGKMNAEDLSIKLTEDGEYCTGWNLVGNPYHGYLDFEAFATNTANQALLAKEETNPFYVIYNADGYTNSINDYVPESAFIYYVHGGSENGAYASQYLHPHQAFFVKMDPEEPNTEPYLQFVDGDDAGGMVVSRSDGETPFREWRPNYPLVNLFLSSDNGCTDVTVVEFERPEWGGATKLKELRSGNGQFYGYHEGRNYAALFAKEGTERVPLWFEAKEDDIFKMKWNTANGDFSSLFLIDNLTGVQYDMLANDSYIFEGHKDDYYSRFYIVFSVTGIEEELEGDDNFAFFDGSEWIVTGEGELDLIDLQGRVLWHDRLTGGQSRKSFPILAKSMYLLRLVNSHETKVQKIIVH